MIDIQKYVKQNRLTQSEVAEATGYSIEYVNRILNGKNPMNLKFEAQFKKAYPDIFAEPLPVLNDPPGEYAKKIPFYDVDVYATISPAMSDMVTLRPSTFINIPMFSQGEYAVQVTGHSMKGYINHGDWIVVKRILNRDAIIYGEPYLVVTKTDNLKTVKFVKPSQYDPDALCLVPYNIEQFEEQDLPKDEILELYRVVGLFRVT